MKKIIFFFLIYLMLLNCSFADLTVDGYSIEQFQLLGWQGLTSAPAISDTGAALSYYNSSDDKLYLSKDGAAYEELLSGNDVALWGLNGTSAYYTDGNVGIGTTNPLVTLAVDGDVVIGSNTTSYDDPAVIIERSIDTSAGVSGHGFVDNSTIDSGQSYAAFDSQINFTGTEDYSAKHCAEFQQNGTYGGSSSLLNWYSISTAFTNSGGNIGSWMGHRIVNPVGAGTYTNKYGLYSEVISGASSNNYQLFCAGTTGMSYVGGKLGVNVAPPLYDFHTVSSISNIAMFDSTRTDYARIMVDAGTGGDSQIAFLDDGSSKWAIGNDSGTDSFMIRSGFGAFGTNDMFTITSAGNVGVGDTDPDFSLEVVDDFAVSATAGGDGDLFIVDATGNVGIGTAAPTSALSFGTDATISIDTTDGSDTGMLRIGGGGGYGYTRGASIEMRGNERADFGAGRLSLYAGENAGIRFYTSNDEVVRFQDSGGVSVGDAFVETDPGADNMIIEGDVGVGDTDPNQLLGLLGTDAQISIEESNTEFVRLGVEATAGDMMLGWDDSDDMHFGLLSSPTDTSVDTRMIIDSTGNLIVGGGTPAGGTVELHLVKDVEFLDLFIETTATNGTSSFILKNDAEQWNFSLRGDEVDNFVIRNAGNTMFGITTDGNASIGSSTTTQRFNVFGTNPQVLIEESTTEFFRAGVSAAAGVTNVAWDDSDDMHFGLLSSPTDTSVDAKMAITSDGYIGVGTTSPGYVTTGNPRTSLFHILGATSGGEDAVTMERQGSGLSNFAFLRARAGAASVEDGDALGVVAFRGHDGTDYNTTAYIAATVDGATSANTIPTALMFTTSTTNSATERMRIDSSGNVGIGTTNPATILHVDSNAANTVAIQTIENTAGDYQTFRADATPEAAITGSIGDIANDTTNGTIYYKQSGSASNTGWIVMAGVPTFKSFSISDTGNLGSHYVGGFYEAPAADATLTIGGAVTQTYGTVGEMKAAHAFVVAEGVGGTDLVLTVTGISLGDNGTRNDSDTEIIVADADEAITDQYFETTKKWVGQVTYTLTGAAGAFTFNYGFAKYDDFGNRDFLLTDFEFVAHFKANETALDVQLIHHKATGWTYSAAAFVPGTGALVSSLTDNSATNDNVATGKYASYKRAGLSTAVDGDDSEGVIIKVVIATNNSIRHGDLHIGALIR